MVDNAIYQRWYNKCITIIANGNETFHNTNILELFIKELYKMYQFIMNI